jgi:hypothetical protein
MAAVEVLNPFQTNPNRHPHLLELGGFLALLLAEVRSVHRLLQLTGVLGGSGQRALHA